MNLPCLKLHSFCATNASSGLETRMDSLLHCSGPVCHWLMLSCILNGTLCISWTAAPHFCCSCSRHSLVLCTDKWIQKVDFVSTAYTMMLLWCDETIRLPHIRRHDQGYVPQRTLGDEILWLLHVLFHFLSSQLSYRRSSFHFITNKTLQGKKFYKVKYSNVSSPDWYRNLNIKVSNKYFQMP